MGELADPLNEGCRVAAGDGSFQWLTHFDVILLVSIHEDSRMPPLSASIPSGPSQNAARFEARVAKLIACTFSLSVHPCAALQVRSPASETSSGPGAQAIARRLQEWSRKNVQRDKFS